MDGFLCRFSTILHMERRLTGGRTKATLSLSGVETRFDHSGGNLYNIFLRGDEFGGSHWFKKAANVHSSGNRFLSVTKLLEKSNFPPISYPKY